MEYSAALLVFVEGAEAEQGLYERPNPFESSWWYFGLLETSAHASVSVHKTACSQAAPEELLIVEGVKKTFQPLLARLLAVSAHCNMLFAIGLSWKRFVLFRAQSSDTKQREAGPSLECRPECCI